MADVVNIARALEELKDAGVWTVGLAGDADKRYDEVDLDAADGAGGGRGGHRVCGGWSGSGATGWSSIPMRGHVQSLNVSVAAGIALFEAVRQRRRRLSASWSVQESRANALAALAPVSETVDGSGAS